jgi:hypothetical protein
MVLSLDSSTPALQIHQMLYIAGSLAVAVFSYAVYVTSTIYHLLLTLLLWSSVVALWRARTARRLSLHLALSQRSIRRATLRAFFNLSPIIYGINRNGSTLAQRMNGEPTPEERIGLLLEVDAVIGEINRNEESISKAENSVKYCESAIPDHRVTIKQKKKEIKTNEDALRKLMDAKSYLDTKNSPGPANGTTCNITIGTDDHLGISPKLTSLIEDQRRRIRSLDEEVYKLKQKLDGDQFSLQLSRSTWQECISHRAILKERLKVIKDALGPIRRTPEQVWRRIFEFTVAAELADYMRVDKRTPIRGTALALSQVCRHWRYIADHHTSLWSHIPGHASLYWSMSKVTLANHALERSREKVTFVLNLSQTLHWYKRNNLFYSSTRPESARDIVVIDDRHDAVKRPPSGYDLLLDMAGDGPEELEKVKLVPLRRPKCIILSSRIPLRQQFVLEITKQFPSAGHLVVLNKISPSIADIQPALPSPQHLVLQFTVDHFADGFSLAEYMFSNIQELYIRHEDAYIPEIPTNVRLYRLKIIGFTPPPSNSNSHLLERVQMPGLKKLILYGPNRWISTAIIHGPNTDYNCNRISTLEFDGWKRPDSRREASGSFDIFNSMSMRSANLVTVKFTHGFVDAKALLAAVGLAQEPGRIGVLDMLHNFTLERTDGITEKDCAGLRRLGKRVNVVT